MTNIEITAEWANGIDVIRKLQSEKHEAYFVGGAVRNKLLQIPVHDFDIATSATPEEIKTIFPITIDVGIAHGTVIVRHHKESIEVTTFRKEENYVEYRRPEKVTFVQSLVEDLQRRDFTMNAIAMTDNGECIDPFCGQQDIEQRIIRTVGNPEERFQEDALRILRGIRFQAQLGFSIEENTLQAMRNCAPLLIHISKERIQQELNKLWMSSHIQLAIQSLEKTSITSYLPLAFNWENCNWMEYHPISESFGYSYLLFYNDTIPVDQLAKAFALSSKWKHEIQSILTLAYELEKNHSFSIESLFTYPLSILFAAIDLAASKEPDLLRLKPIIEKEKNDLPIQKKEELAITGHDLLQMTNKRSGPWIGEILQKALHLVLTKQIKNQKDHLKEWVQHEIIE